MIIRVFGESEEEVSTTHHGKWYSGEDTLPGYYVGVLLYIPGILTSYPSANSIETQHIVGKGKTNTKGTCDTKTSTVIYLVDHIHFQRNHKYVWVWTEIRTTNICNCSASFNHRQRSLARCCKPWRKRQGGRGQGDDPVSQSQSPGNWMYAAGRLKGEKTRTQCKSLRLTYWAGYKTQLRQNFL